MDSEESSMKEIVEEEVRKRMEEEKEEIRKEIREEIENQNNQEEDSIETSEVSRRQFLKIAGVGAGLLSMPQLASAKFIDLTSGVTSTQTLETVLSEGNDINGQNITDNGKTVYDGSNSVIPIDVIDGSTGTSGQFLQTDGTNLTFQDASTEARDVARNAQGEVKFEPAGQTTVSATTAQGTQTATVQAGTQVVFDALSATVTAGAGTMTVRRSGNFVESGTGPITDIGSPETDGVVWTISFDATASDPLVRTTNTVDSSTAQTYRKIPISGTVTSLLATAHASSTANYNSFTNASFGISINGTLKTGTTVEVTSTESFSTKLTGVSYQSPTVTIRYLYYQGQSRTGVSHSANVTAYGTGPEGGPAIASLSISKNEVVTVE